MRTLVYYVSGHGFGHATRAAAILAEARRLADGALSAHVRTTAPSWLFSDGDPGVAVTPCDADVGMIQPNGLDIDFPASLAAHESFAARFEALARAEASWLRGLRPDLVAADIPALACAASKAAGVPCVAVGNFTWDWIVRAWADAEPRWSTVAERYASAYAEATEALRLPLHGAFPAFRRVTDLPLVARRSALDRRAARDMLAARLGIPGGFDSRPLVLVSFGGLGSGLVSAGDGDDLRGLRFIGFGEKPPGLAADWIPLPRRSPVAHADLLAASDLVLSKPGYGIVSECLAHRRKLLYLPRRDFPETEVLIDGLDRWGTGACLEREDFKRGRWRSGLEGLLAAPDRWTDIPLDGAEAAAGILLSR